MKRCSPHRPARANKALPGAYFVLIIITILARDEWIWYPFWMILGLLFMIERVVTVWRSTLFAKFLNVVFLKGIFDILSAKPDRWGRQASSRTRPCWKGRPTISAETRTVYPDADADGRATKRS